MRYEDYLRVIYELSREKGYTRVKEISEALNVKPPTVSEMLKKLNEKGYVIYIKRLFVQLTEKGLKEAEKIIERHETLIKFLKALGIPEEIAVKDACIMEHELHPITVERLKSFVRFIELSPKSEPNWLKHFKEFCKSGKHYCKDAKAECPA